SQHSPQPLALWLIPVLRDNYVMVLQRGRRAAVVDPAGAEPVAAALEENGLIAIEDLFHSTARLVGHPLSLRLDDGALQASVDRLAACAVSPARSH
ncbi:MAG: hypothetical protein ACKOPS_16425, partial [Cyanobium sp.]